MSEQHYYCIIMAGGIGSRFWPISREKLPKQFLTFTQGSESFLRMTYDRMKAIVPEENIIVVSLKRYRDIVRGILPELPEDNLLLETYNRNTAPCIAYATYKLLQRDPLATMVVTPSDLLIKGKDEFCSTMEGALELASRHDVLVTLGIVPTRPDPNFGYIQTNGLFENGKPSKIKTYTEKPDRDLAEIFVESGEFLWNSGIFVWKAWAIREEMERHAPEITNLWKGWQGVIGTEGEREFIDRINSDCTRISIDYAVMEKTDNAWVIPATFTWADIGNWDTLYECISQHDECGNALWTKGSKLLSGCSGNIIYSSEDNKLTAVCGMEGFIVVNTDDVLLVCPRDELRLKEFLSELTMPEFEGFR